MVAGAGWFFKEHIRWSREQRCLFAGVDHFSLANIHRTVGLAGFGRWLVGPGVRDQRDRAARIDSSIRPSTGIRCALDAALSGVDDRYRPACDRLALQWDCYLERPKFIMGR